MLRTARKLRAEAVLEPLSGWAAGLLPGAALAAASLIAGCAPGTGEGSPSRSAEGPAAASETPGGGADGRVEPDVQEPAEEEGWGVEILVVSAESGAALEEIPVTLVVQFGELEGVRKHHVSDADGRCFFPLERPCTLLGVRTRQTARWAPHQEELQLAINEGERISRTVEIPRAGTVWGRVVDAVGESWTGGGEVKGWFLDRWLVESSESPQPIINAPIQPNGDFAIGGLPEGPFTLEAQAEGMICTRRVGGMIREGQRVEGINLKLEVAHELIGEVRDLEGRPVEEAVVSLGRRDRDEKQRETDVPGVYYFPERQWVLTTDASGGFLVPRIPTASSKWRWTARHPFFVTASGKLDPGQRSLRVEVRPGNVMKGRVVGPEGEPLEGARMLLRGQGPLLRHVTPGNGAFHYPGLKDVEHNALLVHAPGFAPRLYWPLSTAEDRLDFTVELQPGRILEGSVADAAGEPLAGLRVEVEPGPEEPLELADFFPGNPLETTFGLDRTRTDEAGAFRFEDLRDRSYTLKVFGPGGAVAYQGSVKPGGSRAEIQLP